MQHDPSVPSHPHQLEPQLNTPLASGGSPTVQSASDASGEAGNAAGQVLATDKDDGKAIGALPERREAEDSVPSTTSMEGAKVNSGSGAGSGGQRALDVAKDDAAGAKEPGNEEAGRTGTAGEGSSPVGLVSGEEVEAAPASEINDRAGASLEDEKSASVGEPLLAQPTPSNPSAVAAATDALLASSTSSLDSSSTLAEMTASAAAPNGASAPMLAPPVPVSNPSPSVSPAPSTSPAPPSTSSTTASTAVPTTAAPPLQKKFQSSLAVNKKFLEKAGEKSKPEVKPVATRLSTSPAPTPVSASHPRLFAGKLSSSAAPSSSVTLSTSTSSPSLGLSSGGWKKPASPAPPTSAASSSGGPSASMSAGSSPALALGGRGSGAPVWGSKTASAGGGMGMGPRGGGGGMMGDFPTAAEAAHAKEARARALMEQVQARERALQARAAAAAAQNAHLLEGLDAFRGVHLDPNASHWDEDEDDFLDTTIEFADGTQYKIVEDANGATTPAATQEDELREPGPNELALREKPLAPGEVVEPPRREERFGDDYDRSWPRRDGAAGGAPNHNLFNARLGQFEPAAAGREVKRAVDPTSILSPRERRTSGGVSDLPPPTAHGHSGDSSRRRGSFTSPPRGRRPSLTSPPTRQVPLPGAGGGRRESFGEQKAPLSAWGRRPSAETQVRPLPPHLAGAGGAGGVNVRQLPPHLQQQQQQQQQQQPSLASQQPPSLIPPPTRQTPLSPPTQRGGAPLPPLPPSATSALSPPAAATATLADAPPAEADLEAFHHREMHAAAERAKKRREEEERERAEQKERARKKAQELEERMKKLDEEKVVKEEREKLVAAPAASAALSPPVAPVKTASETVTSWRQAAKPLPPQAAVAAEAAGAPTKILSREAVASTSAPSTSNAGPPPSSTIAAPAPPTQPSAWRRPLAQPAAPTTRAPLHQLPPHMQQKQQATPVAAVAAPPTAAPSAQVASSPSATSDTALAPSIPAITAAIPPTTEPPSAKPATPFAPAVPAPPASPSQERKATAKTGYKVPAVSQFDDLMSRIKGAMTAPAEAARPAAAPAEAARPAAAPAEAARLAAAPVEEVERVKAESQETPIVKLPGSAAPPSSAATPPPAAMPPNALPHVSLPIPTEPRGRGRGRTVTPRAPRVAPPPSFEDHEPLLPFPSTRIARSHSPPPAWRQYSVRLAPYPARRPPNHRVLKNFINLHHPRPVYSFSFEPPMVQINMNRLTRDDWLMPKRYSKGVVQYSVQLPKGKFDERRRAAAASAAEAAVQKPTVSVSGRQLKRAAPPPAAAKVALPSKEARSVKLEQINFSPFGPEDGDSKPLASGTTWGQPAVALPTASLDDVQIAAETAEAVLSAETVPDTSPSRARLPHKKLPEGSSIGFYRRPSDAPLDGVDAPFPLDRTDSAKMFMVTSELNGEKVETTPRKETTAPGAHLSASTGKSPSSPVFRQPDIDGLMSSPSSSAAWPTKSLVLNPTVASVWSAPPDENPVHARTMSGVRPENSLQGIVDEDPSVALPNSLAELKSEDGISLNEDKDTAKRALGKDEAKLRAVAPSFSSFLHEKAASIDTSSAPTSEAPGSPVAIAARPPLPPSFSSFNPQLPPQSTPSPINAYSPAQPYSPQLHPSLQSYGRPLSQHQFYPSYPPPLASQNLSSFTSHSYSPQPFAPQSPALQAVGYPSSPYRDPTQQPAPPQHITNPALLANYGYGQPASATSSPSRNFGAVGAGGPGPVGRPGSSAAFSRPPPPTSYISSGYGSPYQAPQHLPSPAYRAGEPAYGHSNGLNASHGPPHGPSHGHQQQGMGGGGGYLASTMASPVIMPQQPPQIPHFGGGSPARPPLQLPHQLQHGGGYPIQQHQQGLSSAVQQAAGIPPYAGAPQSDGTGGQVGYGAPSGYVRGLPPSRQGARPPIGAAGFGGRGW
ncbi:hypothetical protein JCM11251_004089 [Rhodosporidiobolus azoricus]